MSDEVHWGIPEAALQDVGMCLILIGHQIHQGVPLVVAANRDESFGRPSMEARFWQEQPDVLGGRDLEAGGSWLAVNRQARFAAVTNFPATLRSLHEPTPSRGTLVGGFVSSNWSVKAYWDQIEPERYQGFNLIIWDGKTLAWCSSRGRYQELPPGFYGLANADLDTPWPKVLRGTQALQEQLAGVLDSQRLLELLADRKQPPDEMLPQRGNELEMERRIAPIFIVGEEYGTRASTVTIFGTRSLRLMEATYGPMGQKLTQVVHAMQYG